MDQTPREVVTYTLQGWDTAAPRVSREVDRLFEIVYGELHSLAEGLLHRERPGHTLRPTALVHEAYLRLVDESRLSWESRLHFFGIAARAMRQILVTHARRRACAKRGGRCRQVTLDERFEPGAPSFFDVLALEDALIKLTKMDARTGSVAELKLFTGLTMREVAQVLGVSKRTADGEWSVARKWLQHELA